ncbi:hypothetical protein ACU8NH_09140 [Rhizobium leguminosarum]
MTDIDQTIGQGKVCTKCGEWKMLDEYHAAKLGKLGRSATCKVCKKAWTSEHYIKNKDKVRERNRENKKKNNKKILEKLKEKYWENPEAARERLRLQRKANPEATRSQNKRSNTKRYADPKFRVENTVRNGIRAEIRPGSKKRRKTFDLLGYSPEQLLAHLEKLFLPGMTWENYGDWHVDHVIPLAAHNYETPDDFDFKRAWALSNLQPLWAKDNMQKGAKLLTPFQPSLSLCIPPQHEKPAAANDNEGWAGEN